MRRPIAIVAAVAALAWSAGPAQAAGRVEVEFVEPEHYTDAGRIPAERAHTMEILDAHLRSLGQRLPDGQVLRLALLDIDLAGNIQPGIAYDRRVLLGGTDAPRMHLRYTLRADGRALKSGEVRLADLDYLRSTLRPPVGELAHDRVLLERWFEELLATTP